ncbi:MAG: hypothetical protein HUU18_00720 [Phycisphaerales bacterium]|nr:hypothetical protein [Phycisphaerales bacterium]
MALSRHLLLMGLRGSGKTSLAPRIAAAVRAPWVDLDTRTREALHSESIIKAWQVHGEAGFRAAEAAALARVLTESPSVIALGGGTPTAPGAVELLRSATTAGSTLIYLRVSPESLARRLVAQGGSDRPSLTGRGVVEEIAEVFAARDPLYSSLATGVVEAGEFDEAGMVARVLVLVQGLVC